MKIKGVIYFILAGTGAAFLLFGSEIMPDEYALSIGIVLLMLGLYKISTSWKKGDANDDAEN